jgi:FkbM family methyltransferase
MLPPSLTSDRSSLESVSRQNCQTLYLGNNTALCRVLGKYIMYVDTEDIGVSPHLCFNGYWETWITVALARALQPGWRCVDIGANHGYYTLIMADAVEAEGRVLAVEPNPRLAGLLRRNIDVNGFLHSTTVLQNAITQANVGTLRFVIPDCYRSSSGTLHRDETASDKMFEVETTSLDEVTKNWPRVDLVKIDAEGAEEMIWEGMRQTLAAHRDITIIMEMNSLRYGDPHKLVREIVQAGFPLRYIDYDSEIKETTEQELISNPKGLDWMLFLRRN